MSKLQRISPGSCQIFDDPNQSAKLVMYMYNRTIESREKDLLERLYVGSIRYVLTLD
jgi:hypothetical protein